MLPQQHGHVSAQQGLQNNNKPQSELIPAVVKSCRCSQMKH
jgi:hypothetical protein